MSLQSRPSHVWRTGRLQNTRHSSGDSDESPSTDDLLPAASRRIVLRNMLAICSMGPLSAMAAETGGAELFSKPKAAPDFTLPTTSGTGELGLKDLVKQKKWVVLYFYPADFSSGCTLEASRFQRDLQEFEERNAQVVGVSVDDLDRHRDFCGKTGVTFPLLSDTSGKASFDYGTLVASELGSFAERQTFLINPKVRACQTLHCMSQVE